MAERPFLDSNRNARPGNVAYHLSSESVRAGNVFGHERCCRQEPETDARSQGRRMVVFSTEDEVREKGRFLVSGIESERRRKNERQAIEERPDRNDLKVR